MTTFPRALRSPASQDPAPHGRERGRGQILVMFAMSITLLFGLMALVIDVGSWWNESLHVQLAAEAAALAGVPYMPGDFGTASTKALAEAKKNGFASGGGTTVTTAVDPESDRRLDVTISRQFNTIFLGLLGMPRVTVTRQAVGEYTLPVPMGSPLSVYGEPNNFWAAAEAQGTNRSAGDAFGTFYNPSPTVNNQYVQTGYQYAIDVPAGAGATTIDIYDPTFCAVDDSKGTGDHWIPWNMTGQPAVSTYYTLWTDPAATPLDYSDDVVVADSNTRFESERQVDKSVALRATAADWTKSSTFTNLPDCQSSAYHNAWWTLATVTTPGTYRLQVTTTNQSNLNDQKNTSSENMWALRATATDPTHPAYVYGLGKMVIYANVPAGTTNFYMSRIAAVHAGKTMVIQLFDPGDASGNSSIQILQPTATGYTPATFSYTADSTATGSKSGTNVTSLATTINGTTQYNNSWVTLTVSLPKTYTAPLPPGEPTGTLGGWWKIKYVFTAATSDTTTWQVSIRGNPVHLVQP